MLKVLSIFGTRPEAIKMAPVLQEFANYPDRIQSAVCVTAQHRRLLDQVLCLFGIKPDVDLNLMKEDQSLSSVTTQAMTHVTEALLRIKPDIVLVQGDTTTAMVAALASLYQKIPVGHVEAGLRTYDRYSPFPEEINRRLLTQLATYHFAPTETARHALLAEGIPADQIHLTGNTVIDTLFMLLDHPHPAHSHIPLNGNKLILVTAHRRESFGQPLENICSALLQLRRHNPDVEIVYPVHRNPNVQTLVYRNLSNRDGIHLIDPLDYAQFIHLMNRAYFILTDSGGIQEEAPTLGKPVLVMRDVTERTEAVEAGTAKVIGTDPRMIVAESQRLLRNRREYERMATAVSPYGDGQAAKRIVQVLLENKRVGEMAWRIPLQGATEAK
ncbi:MAG: non-hydrolyzing UDP-N-acetylglucosamine 2-epimerase [Nitrospinota bacterium]